ncbi:hypothetical protein FO519_007186 [Halicephalobus sp. NKZ332]|nr:hypothetical protein FO519_007186 [Halicephalobus sp. NKZ332]
MTVDKKWEFGTPSSWVFSPDEHIDDHLLSESDDEVDFGEHQSNLDFPCRWLKYSPCNMVVEGTRFLPIKCPLDKKYFKENEEHFEKYFTIGSVVRALEKSKKKIGLVIDLSNGKKTNYNEERWAKLGIKYVKMGIPGLNLKALEEEAPRFNELVKEFLGNQGEKDESLIAVHCTHGINRTGYLICRFLVDECGWDSETAIQKFNEARGHDMERQHYVDSIKNR